MDELRLLYGTVVTTTTRQYSTIYKYIMLQKPTKTTVYQVLDQTIYESVSEPKHSPLS